MNLTIYYKDFKKPREIKGVNKFTFDVNLLFPEDYSHYELHPTIIIGDQVIDLVAENVARIDIVTDKWLVTYSTGSFVDRYDFKKGHIIDDCLLLHKRFWNGISGQTFDDYSYQDYEIECLAAYRTNVIEECETIEKLCDKLKIKLNNRGEQMKLDVQKKVLFITTCNHISSVDHGGHNHCVRLVKKEVKNNENQ